MKEFFVDRLYPTKDLKSLYEATKPLKLPKRKKPKKVMGSRIPIQFQPNDIHGGDWYFDMPISEEDLERVFENFLTEVGAMEVVDKIVLGSHPGKQGAYLWSVLSEDFSMDQLADPVRGPQFHEANNYMYLLKKLSYPLITDWVMAYLNPSTLSDHLTQCEELGIQAEVIPLHAI